MKAWGLNTLRIPILASLLQPPDGQSEKPPYKYSEEGFRYLDSIVKWCTKYKMGVIWDMHGAPGAQSEENIADSDGQPRLWTEQGKYFPMCIDLWYKIAARYKGKACIVGYDLLNEPLLKRYPCVDNTLLRKIYVLLTDTIRTIDKQGIIFIEGDDWAQTYDILEPLNWDQHMAIAFHSYPPTSNMEGLKYWDELRQKYNIPLWHGETGEQRNYPLNITATTFLDSVNVSWAWWTHKKIEINSQPWDIHRTKGFQNILNYWEGRAPRPSKQEAKDWLFDQAYKTNSKYCEFSPEMVRSLIPLNPDEYYNNLQDFQPVIINQPEDTKTLKEQPVYLIAAAAGNHLQYQWFKDDKKIEGSVSEKMRWIVKPADTVSRFYVEVFNTAGSIESQPVSIHIEPFKGPEICKIKTAPVMDGKIDKTWETVPNIKISKIIEGKMTRANDPSGYFKEMYDDSSLYILVKVLDDTMVNNFREPYRNDNVEIYIDPANNKLERYTANEYALRIIRGKQDLSVTRGKLKGPIKMIQVNNEKDYLIELSIPWSSIGRYNKNGYLGLEVQVTDSNGKDKRVKLSWYCDKDNAYFSPYYFGVVRMAEE